MFGNRNGSKFANRSLRCSAWRMDFYSLLDNAPEVVGDFFIAGTADKEFINSAEIAVVFILRMRFVPDADGVPVLQQDSTDFTEDSA